MRQTAIEWMVEMLSENGFIGVFSTNEEAETRKKQLELIISKSKRLTGFQQVFYNLEYLL